MKTVINLSNLTEYTYMNNVDDVVAVCQSYCIENNLSSWFFSMIHNKLRFIDSLPLVIGEKTISCGDYCIVKSN